MRAWKVQHLVQSDFLNQAYLKAHQSTNHLSVDLRTREELAKIFFQFLSDKPTLAVQQK